MRTLFAVALILISVWVLEMARLNVVQSRADVGTTPVTTYATAGSTGPAVVIAHGFAGSEQMMQGYALPLARAGYRVFAFEFRGHGQHPLPMSGDVSTVDGTTRLLVEQTQAVIDAVASGDEPLALLGHSMATDILVRAAATREDIGPVVLISAFSQAIDADHPQNLLFVTGAWEPGLRAFAQEAVQMIDQGAGEAETVENGSGPRRAVAAPFSEHVSVLQSRVGRAEALAWIDQAYGRQSDVQIAPTGWAILGLLGGLVLLFPTVARWLPQRDHPRLDLTRRQMTILLLVPAVITPLIAVPLNPEFLPVLVADYLGLHLMIFGGIQLGLLWIWRGMQPRFSLLACLMLLLWCAIFGFALNRYAANFWPTAERFWIIAAMLIGAVPFMIADARLTTDASILGRLGLRTAFLVSLGIAVALDFESLFFLIMIAPVLVLFFLIFGSMGRMAAIRSGPLSSGLALGLVLAWALGVSFPLFQA